MIVKSFEIKKLNLENNKYFLLYGKNSGLKFDIIKNLTKNYKEITIYDEKEILDNIEIILINLFSDPFLITKKL